MKALQSRRLNLGLLIFLILLGPVLALLAYWLLSIQEQNRLATQFTKDTAEQVAALESEISANLESLYALQGLYEASEQVTRSEFMRYAENVRQRHPAIYALEWIPRVSAAQRLNHEARARLDGISDYRIVERDETGEPVRVTLRKHYFPIYYIEPESVGQAVLGFDVASDSDRRTILIDSMANNALAVTDPVPLGNGQTSTATFLGLLPVYRKPAKTFPARWEQLQGFVLGIFQIQAMLERTLLKQAPDQPAQMLFRLVDPQTQDQPTELFNTFPEGKVPQNTPLARRVTLTFGPQTWELDVAPTAAYLGSQRTYRPLLVGLSLVLLWELIVGLIVVLMKRAADLEQWARLDPLTGLVNRRYLLEQLQTEWQRARRLGQPLSVILIDVDWFKAYNDHHGHRAGDQCLQQLAKALKDSAKRATDAVGRYGGEEFLLLLPNNTAAGTVVVAEKIRAAIEDLDLHQTKAADSPLITVSLGCATQNKIQAEQGWEQLLDRAEQALSQAKQNGRNRFEQAPQNAKAMP